MRSARTILAASLALALLALPAPVVLAAPAAATAPTEQDGAAPAAANPCALPDAASASSEPSGLGGTGLDGAESRELIAGGDEDSGMGGTGVVGDENDGMGGTGIVGTITGFGSICVNGLRITYDADTPTELNGASASSAALAIGDVVSVTARSDAATGELRARAIGVRHLVRGPVDAVDSVEQRDGQAGALELLGQRVVLPEDWDPATLGEVVPGDYLAVSGQRRSDGSILASRVVLLEARDAASLIGRLDILDAGRLRVAGVDVAAEVSIDPALAGEYVVATGAWDPETRSLRSAEVERAVHFDAATTHEISVGGYVEESEEEGLRVGGVRVEAPRSRFERRDDVHLDDYIVVRAVLGADGGIRALRIALDARPPRLLIPRPPRIQRLDRPQRSRRIRIQRPQVVPRPKLPPRIDIPPRPARVLKRVSG